MPQSNLEIDIYEQPEALQRLLTDERANIEKIATAVQERDPKFITLAARGSSDNAGRYAKYLFGAANRLIVALATPSLYTHYDQPPRMDGSLAIAISQSGQSPDIVSVIKEGRRQGGPTVAITNDTRSPLAQAAEHVIDMCALRERSVGATKTYTTSLMAIAMLSTAMTEDQARADERWRSLEQVPELVAQVLANADATIKAAERYRYMRGCVVVSRGYNYATVFENALKLKELTYTLADPYSYSDFQHGPIALIDDGFPVIAHVPQGPIMHEMIAFLRDVRERGAELIVISAEPEALAMAQTPLPVPADMPEWLSPIVNIIQGQLFTLGLVRAKRFDPDKPRGLVKVTLTQ